MSEEIVTTQKCCKNCIYYEYPHCTFGSDSEEEEYIPDDLCERFSCITKRIVVDKNVKECWECPLLIVYNIEDHEKIVFVCKNTCIDKKDINSLYKTCTFTD